MNIVKLHHIAIICSNYEISKHFYTGILGGEIISEVYREARKSYKLDIKIGSNGIIELFSFPSPPARQSNPEGCGLRHLAFCVDDIEASVRELTEKGIEVEIIRVDEITGKKFTFFKDPDNLPLELYER